MKRRNWAWALIFLGIGAFVGLALGQGASRLRVFGRGAERVERVVIADDIRSRVAEEIVIEIPSIPTIAPIPTIPPIPTVPPITFERVAPYEVVERDIPFGGIFNLIGGLMRLAGNLLALLLIVIGAVLILRQRNQPVEKAPPDTAVKPQ